MCKACVCKTNTQRYEHTVTKISLKRQVFTGFALSIVNIFVGSYTKMYLRQTSPRLVFIRDSLYLLYCIFKVIQDVWSESSRRSCHDLA